MLMMTYTVLMKNIKKEDEDATGYFCRKEEKEGRIRRRAFRETCTASIRSPSSRNNANTVLKRRRFPLAAIGVMILLIIVLDISLGVELSKKPNQNNGGV
jgi:hypothetical protein